jgi:glycosyltransferase involved in cell wall biosynthesis
MQTSLSSDIRPLIFWEGFPPCGLLTKMIAEQYGDRLKLLGTRAAVPFEGLEQLLGHSIVWLEKPDDIWERREEYADRNFIIHTGWSHPGWLRFDRWMKSRGATVVVAVDNRWKGSWRQYAGAIWFRLWLRRHFDAAIVPGRSATKLLRFLGMRKNRIFTGYYGAHESIYKPGPVIFERRTEFLYVGQLIHRKGIDILLSAFRDYRLNGGAWGLRIIGSGPMQVDCQGDGIIFEGFGQARHVAQRMAEARCFILPSREDHWGTVVCEAMACGTPVIASRWVGASEDLIRNGINGWVFDEMTPSLLSRCMLAMSKMTEASLLNASVTSLGMAAGYSASSYASIFNYLSEALVEEASQG